MPLKNYAKTICSQIGSFLVVDGILPDTKLGFRKRLSFTLLGITVDIVQVSYKWRSISTGVIGLLQDILFH